MSALVINNAKSQLMSIARIGASIEQRDFEKWVVLEMLGRLFLPNLR